MDRTAEIEMDGPAPGFRGRVFSRLREELGTKLDAVSRELSALDEAAAGETKSSAGDKYETAREMFAQARAGLLTRQEGLSASLEWILRLDPDAGPGRFAGGALVATSEGWLLVGPWSGEAEVDGKAVRGVSLASPLGQACRGAVAGESRIVRGRPVEIRSIS